MTANSGIRIFSCVKCGTEPASVASLSHPNLAFMSDRSMEGNLDEAISIARIVWQQFPEIKLSAEAKTCIDTVYKSFDQRLGPFRSDMLNGIKMLLNIANTLPANVCKEITDSMGQFQNKLESIEDTTFSPLLAKVCNMDNNFNLFINKPNITGKVGEQALKEAWQVKFIQDRIIEKDKAGESDFVVDINIDSGHSTGISVERKTGAQKYDRNYVHKAVRHAQDDGMKYALIAYDSSENISAVGPLYIDKLDGVTVFVTDVQSQGWMIVRYIISIWEDGLNIDKNPDAIDLKKVMETTTEMSKLDEQINLLRKNNNAAIKSCEANRNVINDLETKFGKLIEKLQSDLRPSRIELVNTVSGNGKDRDHSH